MKKLVAVLFGLLVVAAGFAAATTWVTTEVHGWREGNYGWALAVVGVKYDQQNPYTNYDILYRYGRGGLTTKGQSLEYYASYYYYYPDSNSVTTVTTVRESSSSPIAIEIVTATSGWPYI
ncbi:hypothetical protein [Thermococcus thermotolerans]|uniref:hypothetical protein n=1 Tax=Thermococcus thermotolerans TaxID=2969672 RepID=UPI002158858C|nr:hypothetical protein [Thermococcus thermotolerans]